MVPILSILKNKCNFSHLPTLLRSLSGGDINKVFLIEVDEQKWVVKQNNANSFPKMLEKEYRAIKFLHSHSPLYYPKAFAHFEHDNQQYFVLEYIEPGINSKSAQEELGRGLAAQHQLSHSFFGWTEDNYIGHLVQPNQQLNYWIDFFVDNRLLYMSKIAFDHQLLNSNLLSKIENLCHQLKNIIPIEKPALLHGDLWGGNYFIGSNGRPILYDPAVYYGHREMDIAMTALFGGFSEDFYDSYQNELPLESSWKERLPIFQLYPYLVHLNMFGTSYLPAVERIIRPF